VDVPAAARDHNLLAPGDERETAGRVRVLPGAKDCQPPGVGHIAGLRTFSLKV